MTFQMSWGLLIGNKQKNATIRKIWNFCLTIMYSSMLRRTCTALVTILHRRCQNQYAESSSLCRGEWFHLFSAILNSSDIMAAQTMVFLGDNMLFSTLGTLHTTPTGLHGSQVSRLTTCNQWDDRPGLRSVGQL